MRTPRAHDESVILEVRDEGPGIAPDHLKSIFHPFFTTKETGTGLGLALVHQMVVEHGGEITVDSEVGRGSSFRVTLPTARLDLAPTGT
jgi:signal transduction histidine kinase